MPTGGTRTKGAQRVPPAAQARLLVVVSDLHVGSTIGILPEKFVTAEGSEVNAEGKVVRWRVGDWSIKGLCWNDPDLA